MGFSELVVRGRHLESMKSVGLDLVPDFRLLHRNAWSNASWYWTMLEDVGGLSWRRRECRGHIGDRGMLAIASRNKQWRSGAAEELSASADANCPREYRSLKQSVLPGEFLRSSDWLS